MWVVGVKFDGVDGECLKKITGILDPSIFTTQVKNSIQTSSDLNKIIADTPFLSIDMLSSPQSFKKESKNSIVVGSKFIMGERYQEGKSIKGWGSWMVVMKKDNVYTLSFPVSDAKYVKNYLKNNSLTISDEKLSLKNLTVKEIRIENGTYGFERN